MTTEIRSSAPPTLPRTMPRPAPRPLARPLAGTVSVRRAREAAVERAVLGGFVLFALTVSGFAGYGIATGGHAYDVRAVLPAQAGPFAWKKTVAEGRLAAADLDPVTTGSLPERPKPAANSIADSAAAPGPVERPVQAARGAYALRGVADGVATLEGPDGARTAVLGSVLPGAGRVLSIRRTGAGWMIITTETIIGPASL